ncbi:MAG: DMT family transporter [Dongiaceae bacterium]
MAGRQDSEVAVTDKVAAVVNALPVENRRLGLILVVLAALAWSSGGLLLRSVETDPWTTIFWRSLFAAMTLFLFILFRDRSNTLRLFLTMGWSGIVLAVCFATASTSFVIAVQYTSVANVLLLQSLAPFIAGIMGLIFMRERVEMRTWIAMAFAIGGVAIMVSNSFGTASFIGTLFSMLIALGFAGATVVLRYNRSVRMTPAACLATLLAGSFALIMGADPGSASMPEIGYLALLGIGQLALGMILYTTGARLIPAAESALLANIEVVLGGFWVWLVFAEDPGIRTLIGGGVILASLIGHSLVDLRRGGGKRVAPPAT